MTDTDDSFWPTFGDLRSMRDFANTLPAPLIGSVTPWNVTVQTPDGRTVAEVFDSGRVLAYVAMLLPSGHGARSARRRAAVALQVFTDRHASAWAARGFAEAWHAGEEAVIVDGVKRWAVRLGLRFTCGANLVDQLAWASVYGVIELDATGRSFCTLCRTTFATAEITRWMDDRHRCAFCPRCEVPDFVEAGAPTAAELEHRHVLRFGGITALCKALQAAGVTVVSPFRGGGEVRVELANLDGLLELHLGAVRVLVRPPSGTTNTWQLDGEHTALTVGATALAEAFRTILKSPMAPRHA